MGMMMFVQWGIAVMSVVGMAALMQFAWYWGAMETWTIQNRRRKREQGMKLFNGKFHFAYIFLNSVFVSGFSSAVFWGSVDDIVECVMLLTCCCIAVHVRFEGHPPAY